jgi:hypothetical protein
MRASPRFRAGFRQFECDFFRVLLEENARLVRQFIYQRKFLHHVANSLAARERDD